MKAIASAAGKTSAYLVGAACGFALAIPLAAVALGTVTPAQSGAVQNSVAAIQGPRELPTQAHMINRASKGARLELRIPQVPVGTSTAVKNVLPAPSTPAMAPSAGTATAQNAAEPRPARASRPPRGCVSTLGPASLATEELTVCVASLDIVGENISF